MKQGKNILLLLFLGAVLTALTLVFPSIGIIEWVSMIPLALGCFLLCNSESTGLWKAYRYGFFTVFSYYIVLYHWFLYIYPLDFAGLDNTSSVVVVVTAWVGLTLLQAIPGGLMFVGFWLVARTGILRKYPIFQPFLLASLWVAYEWVGTLTWLGVPWGRLAIGQSAVLPTLQFASILGSYGVTFLLVLVNGLIAFGILHHNYRTGVLGLACIIFLSNLVFGLTRLQSAENEDEEKVIAAVIQGNIDSTEKWGNSSLANVIKVHAELTRNAAEDGATVVVWAETALPYALNDNSYLGSFCSNLAKECNITLIVGAFYEYEDFSESNSLFLFYPDGSLSDVHYDKRHLVPFGEYVPMRKIIMTVIPPLANISMLGDDLIPGKSSALFETENGKIGSVICFDSIYETLAAESVRDGAELMVLSTNDSWFFDSAGVFMHETQARIRAIETGRYWVRAANTGVSAIISEKGELLAEIKPLVEGYAVSEVSFCTNTTVYQRIGNLMVWLSFAFVLGLYLFGKVNRKNSF